MGPFKSKPAQSRAKHLPNHTTNQIRSSYNNKLFSKSPFPVYCWNPLLPKKLLNIHKLVNLSLIPPNQPVLDAIVSLLKGAVGRVKSMLLRDLFVFQGTSILVLQSECGVIVTICFWFFNLLRDLFAFATCFFGLGLGCDEPLDRT